MVEPPCSPVPPEPDVSYLVKRLSLTNDINKVNTWLEKEVVPPDAGGDEPEAVFHGIKWSIEQAEAELRDGLRLLILMGDKGNHPSDPRGPSAEEIGNLLVENDFDFFAMHAFDPALVKTDTDAKRFHEQFPKIAETMETSPKPTGWQPFAKYVIKLDPGAVGSELLSTLEKNKKDSEILIQMARGVELHGIEIESLKKQGETRLVSRLLTMIERQVKGPLPEVVFDHGWIAEKNLSGKPAQIKEMLIVERLELYRLAGILAGFVKAPPTRSAILEIWTATLKEHLGDDIKLEKTIAELIENRLGLPVRRKLLRKTVDEIAKMSPPELAEAYEQLNQDLTSLRAIMEERKTVEKRDEKGNVRLELLDEKEKWWFRAEGIEYAWIPLDRMP